MLPDNFFDCDYFALFGLPQSAALDPAILRARYESLQAAAHPDRFAAAAESEKRAALQMASRINDALQTLQNPLRRAAYLLSLHGVAALSEDNTAMPPEFLMQQIEWREALETADDAARAVLFGEIRAARDNTAQTAETKIAARDFAAAADAVREWKYLENLLDDSRRL